MAMVRKTAAQLKGFQLTRAQAARLDSMTDDDINAAAVSDSDNPPLTKDELTRVAKIARRRRGRPALQDNERKVRTTLRLPPEVVDYFRKLGPGWQSKISDTLAAYVAGKGRRPKKPARGG